MNSIKTNKSKLNITEIVQTIGTIIANRETLKNDNDSALLAQTELILRNLELKLTSITKLLHKRKLHRHKKRQNRYKLKKAIHNKNPSIKPIDSVENQPKIGKTKTTIKSHVQLKKLQDARQYLEKFDLLIKLHKIRAKNAQATENFAAQLDNLIGIWSGIGTQNNVKKAKTTEEQWNEVLYGSTNFNGKKLTSKSSRRIRQKWNSYLSDNSKMASVLQIDPVLPPEAPNPLWANYLRK